MGNWMNFFLGLAWMIFGLWYLFERNPGSPQKPGMSDGERLFLWVVVFFLGGLAWMGRY
jgi:hypothetical protein